MNYNILCYLIFFICPNIGSGQSSATEIINKSIAYHDPEGQLTSGTLTLQLSESRPGGSDRKSMVILDEQKGYFKAERSVDGTRTMMQLKKGRTSFSLNGRSKISDEDREQHRLTEDRLQSMKNYYRYLWYLPITLKDPGTIVAPDFNVVDFFGKTSMEIKVTYTPDVGSDIWYFYFDPQSYALVGYRFYHDESANDGEYILLDNEITYDSIRLPQSRKWYTHKEDKYLGADNLVSLKIK